MTRPLRLEFSGALYHITSRGNGREAIYFSDDDYELFLAVLGDVCERFNWVVHAYCLMTNHYHLLVETPDGNLSQGMRQLNGVFTQRINRRYRRVGHLFQGRYKAILVDRDGYLLELCRYIVLNPMRAHMVESLDDYRWSSWHCSTGRASPPAWLAIDNLLSQFAKRRAVAIRKYTEFVSQGKGVAVWDALKSQVFLGSDDFVERQQARLSELDDLREVPKQQRRAQPKAIKHYEKVSNNRDEAICRAYASGGYTLKTLGDHFSLHYSRVSKIVAKGELTPKYAR
jgi:REP element-mobilizing transposase RayT